jgi:hypothetical protein
MSLSRKSSLHARQVIQKAFNELERAVTAPDARQFRESSNCLPPASAGGGQPCQWPYGRRDNINSTSKSNNENQQNLRSPRW